MFSLRFHNRLCLAFVFALSIFLTPVVHAQSTSIVDSFFFLGKRIDLHNTETPGVYEDKDGKRWITYDKSKSTDHYRYKYLLNATPKEIETATKLSETDTPNLLEDHRGQLWIRRVDAKDGDKLIPLSEAGANEVTNVYGQFDLRGIFVKSPKTFAQDNIKFNGALAIVTFATCFGPNFLNLTFAGASAQSPACIDAFITQLLDWKGFAGFYAFMVGQSMTSEGMLKVMMLANYYRANPRPMAEMRAKFMPLFGYFGMAGGSLLSQITGHLLSNPYWGPCIKNILTVGVGSDSCQKAYMGFITDEAFWDEFVTGTPTMLLASFAAAKTQEIIVKNYLRLTESAFAKRMGYRIIGGSEAAIKLALRLGPRAAEFIRFGVFAVGGVPGIAIFVATEVGQFVLFFAWQEVFKSPVTRGIHDWAQSNKTNEGVTKLDLGSKGARDLKWEKAFVQESQSCINVRTGRYQTTPKCATVYEEPLTAGLALLDVGAAKYREQVLLDKFDEEAKTWSLKTANFVNKYRVSKMILEHTYRERQNSLASTSLNLPLTANVLAANWLQALSIQAPEGSKEAASILMDLMVITQVAEKITNRLVTPIKQDEGFADSLVPHYTPLIGSLPSDLSAEEKLRALLIKFQGESDRNANMMFPIGLGSVSSCVMAPDICKIHQVTLALNFDKIPAQTETYVPDNTRDFLNVLLGIYGEEFLGEALGEFLCGTSDTFRTDNTDNNGRVAHFTNPLMLQLDDKARDRFVRENCADMEGNPKFILKNEDLMMPWILGDKVYPDVVSLLIDKTTPLKPGKTMLEAQNWWQANGFPIISQFLKNMTLAYQKLLEDRLFTQVPNSSSVLIESVNNLFLTTRPTMRGTTLDLHIVTLDHDMFNRPMLSESLFGQANYIIDKIRYDGPDFPQKTELLEKIRVAFAEYILGLNYVIDKNRITSEWSNYENDIKTAGSDLGSIDKANTAFDVRMREVTFGKKKSELIGQQSDNLIALIDELYAKLSNSDPDELDGAAKGLYRDDTPPEEASKLSKEDYKKYIFFRLENDSLNNIVIEIGKLYDKLGLQPFTGLPEDTLEN